MPSEVTTHAELTGHPAEGRPEWKDCSPLRLFERLASEPAIGDGVRGLCEALPQAMALRTLELVALRVSAVLDCSYVFSGHCHIAVDAVLSAAEVAAVAAGPGAFAAGHDQVVLRAVDELLGHRALSAASRSALGYEALVVTVATATYRIVAGLMADVDPEPGIRRFAGLSSPAEARSTHAARSLANADHSAAA